VVSIATMSSKTICVFCASSEAVPPAWRALAADLGAALAADGWSLVYGGGSVGLMGEVARAALDSGAHVTGVIPHRLADREIALHRVSELVRTDTMRERKHLMDERADAFVVLPGGIGTLEEVVEILTLKQLGYHDRAVVFLDPDGFWAPLEGLLRQMVDRALAHRWLLQLWHTAATVPDALEVLRTYRPPPTRPISPVRTEALEATPDDAAERP
jgi:uncharacterized protein (TIGR00730 family)